jgi:thymidylate kinase
MLTVAIEGPCCSGKTTLSNSIVTLLGGPEAVTVVPDYADFVGGGDHMPDPAPPTIAQELDAIDALLNIEVRRFANTSISTDATRLTIIDRSALTLIGHANGLDWEMGEGCEYQREVARVVFSDVRAVVPTKVIYLSISAAEQRRRNRGKFEPESIFIKQRYNDGFEDYFRNPAPSKNQWEQVMVDGEQPMHMVLDQCVSTLKSWDPVLLY